MKPIHPLTPSRPPTPACTPERQGWLLHASCPPARPPHARTGLSSPLRNSPQHRETGTAFYLQCAAYTSGNDAGKALAPAYLRLKQGSRAIRAGVECSRARSIEQGARSGSPGATARAVPEAWAGGAAIYREAWREGREWRARFGKVSSGFLQDLMFVARMRVSVRVTALAVAGGGS